MNGWKWREGANWYWFTEQKACPKHNENAIDFSWLDVQEEDDEYIAKANFIESL